MATAGRSIEANGLLAILRLAYDFAADNADDGGPQRG
jgi:hypothetical protein